MKIQAEAETLEEALKQAKRNSEQLMHPQHLLALVMNLASIAVSLTSITGLIRKQWLFGVAAIFALRNVVLFVWAFI